MEQPEFLKTFFADESWEKLLIPAEFMEEIMEGKEEFSAILVGPNGIRCPVEIVEENNYWFFKRGWNTFVEDNFIGEMDDMLFTYVGAMNFSVKFFLPNGLKKPAEGSMHSNFDASPHVTRKRTRGNPNRKHGTRANPRSRGQPHVVTPKEQDVADIMSTNHPFLVRTLIWRAGKFPVMHIPNRFLNEHGLTLNKCQKIGLHNYLGRRWEVKVNKCVGAFSFGKGFPRFLHNNHVVDGDTLVYEVIDSATMELQVHIYN